VRERVESGAIAKPARLGRRVRREGRMDLECILRRVDGDADVLGEDDLAPERGEQRRELALLAAAPGGDEERRAHPGATAARCRAKSSARPASARSSSPPSSARSKLPA